MPKAPYRTRRMLHPPVDRPEAWTNLAALAHKWAGPEGLSDHVVRQALSLARHARVLGAPGPANVCTLLADAISLRLDPPRKPAGLLRAGIDAEAFEAAIDNREEILRFAEAVTKASGQAAMVKAAMRGAR